MWNEEDRKWLYEQMRNNGVDTGSYQEFSKSLENKEDRDWYYQKSLDLGLDVGSANDFAGMMVQPRSAGTGGNVFDAIKGASAKARQQAASRAKSATVSPSTGTSRTTQTGSAAGAAQTSQPGLSVFGLARGAMAKVKQQAADVKRKKNEGSFIGRMINQKDEAIAEAQERAKVARHRERENNFLGRAINKVTDSVDEAKRDYTQQQLIDAIGNAKTPEEADMFLGMARDNRAMRQQINDAHQRMENMRKASRGEGGWRVNPQTKRYERTYYTMTGEEVNDPITQRRINKAREEEWEATTDEGREEFVSKLLDGYGINNATETAWEQAGTNTQAAREQHNREIWDSYSGGREARMMATGEMYASNLADYLTYHDLQRMADDAWNNLGKMNQQEIVNAIYNRLKKYYPDASEGDLRNTASAMARQQSDRRMYELAVEKNAPSSATEMFFRKALGANLILNLFKAGARAKAGTTGDMAAREDAEARYEKSGHKVASIAGTVAGFMADPLMWMTGGIGSAAAKGATWLGGKVAGEVAINSFAGRLFTGAAASAASLGTFMGASEGVEQLKWGGYRDPETGEVGDYSPWEIAKSTLRGAGLGLLTGAFGTTLGNISDKAVRATESTAGKVALRVGELGVGTVAEGTIFSIPEWISGDMDAMDVWTENMAMMIGFKGQHLIKSAPRVIAELGKVRNPQTIAERNQNRIGFEGRLRQALDGRRPDLALTKDEKAELERGGYTDLRTLTDGAKQFTEQREQNRKQLREAEVKLREATARYTEEQTNSAKKELEQAQVNYDSAKKQFESADASMGSDLPYERFQQLISDTSISEAARAKMYYYLTGRQLPMSTIMGASDITEVRDTNGKVAGYNVQSYGAQGVITSRTFGSRKAAEAEQRRIYRQVELNGIDIGEQHNDHMADQKRMEEACRVFGEKVGAPTNTLYEMMKKRPEQMSDIERQWAEQIIKAYNELGNDFQYHQSYGKETNGNGVISERIERVRTSEKLRADILEQYGVDIDKAIKKEPGNRSKKEELALEDYIKAIYSDVEVKREQAKNRASEESSGRTGEQPNTDIAGLLSSGADDGPTRGMSESKRRGYNADERGRRDIAIALSENPDDPEAQAAWGGVQQRIEEEADYMAAQDREVANRLRHADGQFHPVTLSEQDENGIDKQAYLIDGTVNMTADGTMVDASTSDTTVVIYDPLTGGPRQIPPTNIKAMGEVISAEDYDANIERSREQYVQNRMGAAQGVLNVVPGERVMMPEGDEALVVSIDDTGENVTVLREDGSQVNVTRDELQRVADEAALADYRQRHGDGNDVTEQGTDVGEQKPAANGEVVAGVPAEYVPGMEIIVRGDDGTERLGMVMGMMRMENGQLVPDPDGRIVEYLMDNDVQHTHIDMLNDMVVGYVGSKQADEEQVGEIVPEEVVEDMADETPELEEVVPEETPVPEPEEVIDVNAMPMVEVDGKLKPDFFSATPERSHEYIYNERGYSNDVANQFVENNIKAEQDAIKKLDKKEPKMGTDMDEYDEKHAVWQEQKDAAQGRLDYWGQVREIQKAIEQAEKARADAERAAKDEETYQQALRDEEAYQAEQLAKQQEQAARGANAVGDVIREKWEQAPKVVGFDNEITLANGERITGKYVLVESGAVTPSHDANHEFVKNDGFPVDENGNTVNDRDYERDKDAQEITRNMANNYDGRALQYVPVVTNDGVVLSGNGRTMAGELAAANNTDGAYVEHLRKYRRQFGFTPEQVGAMQHPRVVFVPDEALPYTTETFAKFNAQEMKGQNKTEQAVKLGKVVDDATFHRVINSINEFDTLGEFYADQKASVGAINELRDAGVINAMQYGEMFDGEKLSDVGKNMLENMLIGKAFESNPDAIRQLSKYPSLRQSVVAALAEISNNVGLGAEYSLESELAEAIKLAYEARNAGRKSGEMVSAFARQRKLFEFDNGDTVTDYNNLTILMLADVLNDKRVNQLKKTLSLYNRNAAESAAGQMDIFSGSIKEKEDIIKEVLELLNYGTEQEIEQQLADATEQRKQEAGREPGGENESVEQAGAAVASGESGESEPVEPSPVAVAEQETNTEPTAAQKEAGNYKKGHLKLDGFNISIENPKGSIRSGKDASGKEWSVTMQNTYGYIRGTEGVDGDHIDVFLSDNLDEWNGTVYVIDQVKADGSFDEHKVMYGFNSAEEAAAAYNSNYSEGWQGLGTITGVSKEEFKKWIGSSHRKTKPFADYKKVKTDEGQSKPVVDDMVENRESNNESSAEDIEAGGAVVSQLQDMGLDISTDIGKNNETLSKAKKDNSKEGEVKYFKTSDGIVYGFTYRGGIYLDPRKINAELPLHEYSHLWNEAMQRLAPENWRNIVNVLKADADSWSFIKSLHPELDGDDAIADAMIAEFSGRNGAEKLKAELERMSQRDPNYKSKWKNIFKNIIKAIQDYWKSVGDFLKIKYTSPEQIYDQVLRDFASGMNPRKRVEEYLASRDKEYVEAAAGGDIEKATRLFNEALKENIGNGMTPFIAVGNYRTRLRPLAHKVKQGDVEAIQEVASLMAPIIPENAVLVPAPSHTGRATYMLDIANEIAKLTGAEVADVLQGIERGTQYEQKKTTGKAIASAEMGITVNGELPKGKIPVVLDNVVASGNTAEACIQALGTGIVCSLAKATDEYKHVSSLKNANPIVRDSKGDVIPLSKRFDLSTGKNLGRVQFQKGDTFTYNLDATDVALRDGLVDVMRNAGVDVITDDNEAQRVLSEANGRVMQMGTTTRRRQEQIGKYFDGRNLSEQQRSIVDVFSEKNAEATLSINDIKGKLRRIIFRQGQDSKAGVKHSVFRHYNTNVNNYTADEILFIPDIVNQGIRKQSGNKVSYSLDKNGITYTVTTQLKSNGEELFTNYYTNRKPTAGTSGASNTATQHAPQQSVSGAKLQKVVEPTNKAGKNIDNDTLFNAAKKKFGSTNDLREAGYILPDGTMLDYSGRHELFGADDSGIKGRRATDHRVISSVAYDYDQEGNEIDTGIETNMPDFIRRGAIRIDYNNGSINLSTTPTSEQRNVLRRLIAGNDGDVYVDFGDGWDSDHYAEYSEAKPSRVLNDIEHYFRDGIKPSGNVQFFKTENGDVYGFVKDGKIYIDPKIATSETPIHEYSHLWSEALEQVNPEAWAHLKEQLTKDQELVDFVRDLYPEIDDENELMHEVFSQFSGKRGKERLEQLRDEEVNKTKDIAEKARIFNMFHKLAALLKGYWEMARDLFAGNNIRLKKMSAEDFADMALNDLLRGFNPKNKAKNVEAATVKKPFYSNAEKAVDGIKQNKATSEQWKAMLTKAGGSSGDIVSERVRSYNTSDGGEVQFESAKQLSLFGDDAGTGNLFDGLERREEPAATGFDPKQMSDEELLTEIGGDENSLNSRLSSEEYDRRHLEEYNQVYDGITQQLEENRTTKDQADEMLCDIVRQWRDGHATGERTALKAQFDALNDYYAEKEAEEQARRDEIEDAFSDAIDRTQSPEQTKAIIKLFNEFDRDEISGDEALRRLEDLESATVSPSTQTAQTSGQGDELASKQGDEETSAVAHADAATGVAPAVQTEKPKVEKKAKNDPTTIRMRKLVKGETCHVERRYVESKQFDFTGSETIQDENDVAYIFRQLENSTIENVFLVLRDSKGRPTILHVGMGGYAMSLGHIGAGVLAAAALKPKSVVMVHNHPSGTLTASPQDVELLRQTKKMFGEKVVADGIIINVTSGKYCVFNERDSRSANRPTSARGDEVAHKVYTFSKAVFDKEWNPETAFQVVVPDDVAKFVSSHRLGEHDKYSLLVINNQRHITGNIFLPWKNLDAVAPEKVAKEIAKYVHQMGGMGCIIYGSGKIAGNVRTLRELLKNQQVTLTDFISVNSESAQMRGVLEPAVEYNGTDNKPESKREAVEQFSETYNVPIKVYNTPEEVTHSDPAEQERRRNAKGWYDPSTGEIGIVLSNNGDVDDAVASAGHETIGHYGLRELVGEENYNKFLDEVYKHLRYDLKQEVDSKAGRAFMDSLNGSDGSGRSYEQHRRKQVDELFARMAEKPFEEFSEGERSLWQVIKATVRKLLDKFLGTLRLPKWFTIGDNELRYMLWRSAENLKRGKEHPIALARDIVKRKELGLDGETVYRETDELEDIMKDPSLNLDERITATKLLLSNNHSANTAMRNDALNAVGVNLSSLRRAMSAQRKYDQSTAKRVADLARVLIGSGQLNDLSAGEVKRLLSAVKNSVGQKAIEASVQKVMDIMVDNQLKNGEAILHELETIKATKVNAKGVEVQGQLDPVGAQMVKTFRKARGWEKSDIEDAMAEAEQRMGSDDNALAEEAATDYAALSVALEYVENIKNSKAEEHNLREELKQKYAETSREDRAKPAYKQYVAIVEDAIRQNKIDRAQAYIDLVGRLSGELTKSIANAKAFKEAEVQRIREIQHNANSDMEGRPSNEHYRPKFMDKFVNNDFVQGLFAPLATFDQMLRLFGGKSANGEGYLHNRFMRGWVDARQKEIKGVRDKFAILDKKAAELFDSKVKNWGQLIRYSGKLPKATVKFWDGGEMKDHELTQGNLMYMYMVDKMLDGKMKLRGMGITDEDMERVEQALDPRIKELADWLQDEFLVQTRNEYNETHKRTFGASMAAIEHYFPLKILANARADKPEDLDNPDMSDGISTATGAIIKRKRNGLALDITGADALSVILDHVAEMEHWNAFAEFNRDLNTLRTYRRFRNQVQNMTTIYGSGKRLWVKFNNVCQMAAGTYRPPRAMLDEAAVNFSKGVTAAKVSMRVFTALKQFLSAPAYIPEVRADHILVDLVNPFGAWMWSMKHLPIFNERWKSRIAGDPRLMKSDMDWKLWRSRIMQLASRFGMSPNAFVDALTVSIGAHAMYKTRRGQYRRDGYSQEVAEQKAIQDAEMLYNQTQQSSEGPFLSTMQVDRSWLSVLLTVFRNASMSYQRQLHDALRNLKRNLTPGAYGKEIEFMTKQFVRDGIDEGQAKKAAKRKYGRQLVKDAIRLGVFGYVMQLAWNLGAYLPYLLFGDDGDEKQKMWDDVIAKTYFGSLEGLTGGDVMSEAGRWIVTGEGNPDNMEKDMPITSDAMSILQKFGYGKHADAITDIANLVVQSGIGVNPQSITDGVLAVMDACGDDPALAHEAAICVSRILQVPQSQIEKMYFDEVGLSGSEISNYTYTELVHRYAAYKVKRGRFLMPWEWDDEDRLDKEEKKATKKIKERIASADEEALKKNYSSTDTLQKKIVGSEVAKRMGGKDTYNAPKSEHGKIYLMKRDYVDLAEDVVLQSEQKQAEQSRDSDRAKVIKRARDKISKMKANLGKGNDAEVMQGIREARRQVLDEFGL